MEATSRVFMKERNQSEANNNPWSLREVGDIRENGTESIVTQSQ